MGRYPIWKVRTSRNFHIEINTRARHIYRNVTNITPDIGIVPIKGTCAIVVIPICIRFEYKQALGV